MGHELLHDKYIEYLANARPDNDGLPYAMFYEDWEPIGPSILTDLAKNNIIYINQAKIFLHRAGNGKRALFAHPPDKCDMCGRSLRSSSTYFDAVEPNSGRWGWMCFACFIYQDGKVGPGCGQQYCSRSNLQLHGGMNTI